jgi:hypothetical protein
MGEKIKKFEDLRKNNLNKIFCCAEIKKAKVFKVKNLLWNIFNLISNKSKLLQ